MTKVLDKIPLVKYDRIVKPNEYYDIIGFLNALLMFHRLYYVIIVPETK